jgi:PAS domain S-box-containing protein
MGSQDTAETDTLHEFLEAAPDAIVVVDREGVITTANELAARMFGYSPSELSGKKIEVLVPERYQHIHMVHREQYVSGPRKRPMGAGRALTGLKKDGSEFPIEISLSPLRSEGAFRVISIIRDLTDRLRSEAKFRGFLESAPDAVVVVNDKGEIVTINSLTEKMFGYSRDELLGKEVEVLVPQRYHQTHVGQRSAYSAEPRTRPMGAGRELTGQRKDGSEFPVEISLSPLETEGGTLVISIVRDVTQRHQAEAQIKASLREKEVLLKEIHHRVKNNLQITSSLLKLQSGYIQDPRAREMFAESQNRIRSMALVHEKLYQSSDLSRIDFSDYIRSLASLLFRSFGVDRERIALKIEGDHIFLSVETAVPCGLIVNELLSNCIKHAFPEGSEGEVVVGIHGSEPGGYVISVKDTGVGLPKDLDLEQTETLGLQLVRTLAGQLRAEVNALREGGTEFRIRFMEVRP